MTLMEHILLVPGVYIILTYSTQIGTMSLMEDILCVPGVYIIPTYSTQHTDRYNGPMEYICDAYLEYTSY